MTPAQPPLPTAWNLPFQPPAGSQTSTLISESSVGFTVAATRQNGNRVLNRRAAGGGEAPAVAGGGRAPAEMVGARVIVGVGSVNDVRPAAGRVAFGV